MGVVMAANITIIARQDDSSYPYPNTITEYLTDSRVEPKDYDMKVWSKKPFSWYCLIDTTDPKRKVHPPDEPDIVNVE